MEGNSVVNVIFDGIQMSDRVTELEGEMAKYLEELGYGA